MPEHVRHGGMYVPGIRRDERVVSTVTWDSLNRRVLNSKRKELLIEHSIWK